MTIESPSHLDWISFPDATPATTDLSAGKEVRKQIAIAATCSNTELRNLIQTTTEALESVSFSITSQNHPATIESPQSLESGSRHIVITASCLPKELGKLMQVVTDTMGSVSFTVSSGGT